MDMASTQKAQKVQRRKDGPIKAAQPSRVSPLAATAKPPTVVLHQVGASSSFKVDPVEEDLQRLRMEDLTGELAEANTSGIVTTSVAPTISSPSTCATEKPTKSSWSSWLGLFLRDKWNLAFLVVLFFGLLLRLRYLWQESLWNDAAVHLWYAVKVTKEPLFFFSQQYLGGDYAVPQTFTALTYLFTNDAFLAGKIVALVYGMAGIIFMFLLGKELRSSFTGVLASALLAFNHIAWFYAERPLADSPLLVTTIILLYCMVKLERQKTMYWGVLSGVMFLVAMFTKVQSSLFVFALLLYYLLFRRKEMISHRPTLVSWVIPVAFLLIAHVVGKILFNTEILDRIFRLFVDQRGMPYGFEAAGMLQWIFTWYLIPFIVLGIILVIAYRQREYYFSIILLLFYWLFFEINVDSTQDRYLLPLLAAAIILAVFAIEEIGSYLSLLLHKHAKALFALTVVVVICFQFYSIGDPLIYSKSFTYAGYPEAGRWLKENVPADVPIFAGSPRSMRAFVERDFGGPGEWDEGGNLWYLRAERYLDSSRNFEDDLALLVAKSDVYVEIDIWEYTQPKWYFPIRQESVTYFQSLGFQIVHVVERDVPTNDGLKKTPAVLILKKDKEA